MGQANAAASIREVLAQHRPALVLTCGFAGGLNPKHAVGDILFDTDDPALSQRLLQSSAQKATLHCSNTIIATAKTKATLHQQTGADAVEMESGVIRHVCVENGIPSATVRIISDGAKDDLPIDFSQFLTTDQKVRIPSLALHVLVRPGRLIALLKFHQSLRRLASKLADALATALPARSQP